jgi:hypothetical protein
MAFGTMVLIFMLKFNMVFASIAVDGSWMDGCTLNLCLSEVDVSTDRLCRPLSWPLSRTGEVPAVLAVLT